MVNGVRVRYLRAGSGPALLLLHGLLGYSFSWRRNLAELARRRTVFALDLPGLGYSDRVPLDASLRALARLLLGFMDVAGIAAADVIGSSHGGALAIMLAVLDATAVARGAPRRIRSLILVAPVNPWSRLGRKRVAVLASGVGRACARLVLPRLLPRLQRLGVRRMYGDVRRIPPGTFAGYGAPLAIPGTVDHLLRVLRCWRADLAELEPSLPCLGALPVLLLWGSLDRAVAPASAHELQRRLPHARLVLLPGVGHLPYEEAPADFNAAVLEFLALSDKQ